MGKATLLKRMIQDKEILCMPGVYDALSAKIAENCGFKAVQVSGYGISASFLGMTDASFTSLGDVVPITKNIASAVSIPVMADADTGFGNAVNVWWTTKKLEQAGAAGMNLEDQLFPKRCGHMLGKELISLEEMIGKIRAAVDAKVDKDFVINARTDAIAVCGVEEAIKRGNAYAEAGADLIYVEAPTTIEMIKRVIHEIKAPVSICMVEGGLTPRLTFAELEKLGAARVSCPGLSFLAAAYGVQKALIYLMEHGTSVGYDELMSFSDFQILTHTPMIRAMEEKYKAKSIYRREETDR